VTNETATEAVTSETKAEAKAEVARLRQEVSKLHAEEEALIREVAALRQQVSQLHAEECVTVCVCECEICAAGM
jgi:cell division protein FtsB